MKVVHTVSTPIVQDEEKLPWVTSDFPPPKIGRTTEEKQRAPVKKMSVPNIMERMGRATTVGTSGPKQRVQSLDRGVPPYSPPPIPPYSPPPSAQTSVPPSSPPPIPPYSPSCVASSQYWGGDRTRLQPSPIAHDDPSPMGSPIVVKALSPTSGCGGGRREKEKKEAVGNINRMFSFANMRKDDVVRKGFCKSPGTEQESGTSFEESHAYRRLKAEEIQKSKKRANFLGGSEQIRIPKSPRPFRESPSPQVVLEEKTGCSCPHQEKFPTRDLPFNTITDLMPRLNEEEATHIGLGLMERMSEDTVVKVIAC